MKKFILNKKSASSMVVLSFGLMAGCSDNSTSPTLPSGDNSGNGQSNVCIYDGYSAVAGTNGETICMDAAGNLAFWINADGSYGFPEAATVDPCNGMTAMVGDDGTTYCFDEKGTVVTPSAGEETSNAGETTTPSTEPVVDPVTGEPQSSASAEQQITTCTDVDGTSVAPNALITAADGSTYMYNSNCQKVTLSEPASSSSVVIPQPVSSSSATNPATDPVVASSSSAGGITPVSSSVFVSESNGNAPAIAYAASGATVTNNNGCVSVTGGEVVISCAGDYDFSGSYKGADAQIRVYSPKADSGVYLNLRGLTLENTVDAPIYVQQASKTFVVAKKETVNTLIDAATRTKTFTYQNANGETKVDTTAATIYSKDDLTIKGAGTLKVTGNANNGIHSANDLRFRGETIVTVNAKNNGVKGKGSVQIGSGTLTITATEGDGIKSDECVENASLECTAIVEGKGIVEISGGTINITAGDDGIQAINKIYINENDGAVNIKVKAGDGEPDVSGGGFGGGPGGGNFGGGFGGFGGGNWGGNTGNTGNTGTTTSTESSNKGIVSADSIIINAGTIEVASHKDAIHSNTYVDVYGGNFTLAGRNAIHADEVITIHDGTIHMTETFEALEARQIIAKGGVTASESSNDGWNAGTGNEGCTGNCKIEVTGGVHYLHIGSGDTDGMDSNGDINISGGVVVVECEISGGMGGSFDANGKTSITAKSVLGFSKSRSEAGTNYNVSFNTSGYYGNSNIAFKPTTSGSYIQATSQPSSVSNVSSYAKSTTLPNGYVIYYNN